MSLCLSVFLSFYLSVWLSLIFLNISSYSLTFFCRNSLPEDTRSTPEDPLRTTHQKLPRDPLTTPAVTPEDLPRATRPIDVLRFYCSFTKKIESRLLLMFANVFLSLMVKLGIRFAPHWVSWFFTLFIVKTSLELSGQKNKQLLATQGKPWIHFYVLNSFKSKKNQCDPRAPLRTRKKQDIAFYYKKALKVIETHDSLTAYNENPYKKPAKTK